jgi:cytochrome c551/c552
MVGYSPGRQRQRFNRSYALLLLLAGGMLAASCGNEQAATDTASGTTELEAEGRAIFRQNCATCHLINKDATGPALRGVAARWDNDTARLKAFIRNPGKAIFTDKDPAAVRSYEKYQPIIMTAFPNLTEEELDALLHYIK